MGTFVDLSGKTYHDWTVIGRDPVQKTNLIKWLCQCRCGNFKSVTGANITSGKSKSCGKCNQVIYGFGVNDLNRIVNNDPIYFVWKRMVERCHAEKFSTYRDKFINKDWRFASKFEKWMIDQPWEGMELDKDLLIFGNKEYGPNGCAFVPKRVNVSLGTSERKRGEYPLGVCYHNDGPNRYLARCAQKYLGVFPSAELAHKAWQAAKAQDLIELVDWWQFESSVNHTFNQKIAENIFKVVDRLTEDLNQGLETKFLI